VTELNLNTTGSDPEVILSRAHQVILPGSNGHKHPPITRPTGALRIGVDLGTAYTVLVVLDEDGIPITGEYRFTQFVRDGLVVDYIRGIDILREMKENLEARLGLKLNHAASGYPPGVPSAEVQASANLVEAAGMNCQTMIPEPIAANNVLSIHDGIIVDVGGGTTGIAIIKNGEVVYTADEATGGTHFSLVIAGAEDISFEKAEELKINPLEQPRLYPIVRPVMEKIGTIIAKHQRGNTVESIVLVGGTALFPGIDTVIQEVTGLPTRVSGHPLFVTPVGIAMQDHSDLIESQDLRSFYG